ncbi:head GIN domain-containing protein [Flavobacterium buctense]|uniref:Head GIN domain-containing protein n=1 Tax=Flavobacterium buctense TaxID=1648146 RepID=A0ABU9DXA1_9FLAO|nr:head GIN domain-containing protein [Flavobacterium buctense]
MRLVYSLLVFSSIAFGQVEKNVGDFTKVTSFDQIDVYLVKSNQNKVVIDGKEANEVELVNKNGELKIRMPLTKLLSGDNISVTVYFNNLTAVEANEGSRIACGDKINSTSFEINAKEGSQIRLTLEVGKLNVRVANGSTINLEGNADTQDVLVNSGGIFEAKNFKTNQTVIALNAGGEADIYATDLVEAKVRAGGDITIYGKPKQINQKVIAGGNIEEAKQ